ncbi:MAG: trimethylamine methyltransferase family protein [Thermoleophilia bacterium]|nr:trimethylamine methyltransferase family protein [Thermoleophilia bacterium]
MSPKPETTTTPARLDLRVLGDDELAALHERALRLLADDGVLVTGEVTARAFVAAGARVADGRGRIAPRLVHAALDVAPPRFSLGARLEGRDVELASGAAWLATGGPAALTLAAGAAEPRPATGADLAAVCRLADALPEVAVLYGPPLCPARETPLGALQVCLAAAGKHVHVTTLRTAAEAEAAARIAAAVAGGLDAARRRSPLSLGGSLENALAFAAHGLPVTATAELAPGAKWGDPGLSETVVRRHAGILAACVAVQAVAPGAPFMYATADAAVPQTSAALIAAAQLAARAGLPTLAPAMLTRSPAPDWQACSENAFSSMSAVLAGADIVSGAGTLAGGTVCSAVALALDSEIHSWNAAIAAGIPVDEETLAAEAIHAVGIGGNYLSQRHTRRHMKDVWRPRLLDRSSWDAWVAGGCKGAPEAAAELVRTTLDGHTVAPLEAAVADRINEIIATVQ